MLPRARLVVIRIVAILAAAAVASGCASNVASSFGTAGAPYPTLPPGSVKVIADGGLFVSATIGLSAAAANVLSGIFLVGFLAAGNDISPLPPAKMREDRAINLQDCSKPIANWSANLRCATSEELRELEGVPGE
ncbi:MAG TPA: hypothetical protein VFN70_08355 [Burkholderiales bacterium]|nr:hypothetical protein [Burkholderiales bacterium]